MKRSNHLSYKANLLSGLHFMKSLLLFIVFSLINMNLTAQSFESKFGRCSEDEIEMTHCPFDSTADAMILYDIGNISFELVGEKYQVVFERKTKYKFFNKSGIDYAKCEIEFYDGNQGIERVTSIKCNTYNMESGKITVTKLDNKSVFEEKSGGKWRSKKFAMPGVKEGSVVEVSYRISSPYIFSLPAWKFQSDIPIMYSEVNATINPHFEYTFIKKGDISLADYKQFQATGAPIFINGNRMYSKTHQYILKDVPAFKDESYITSKNDYLNRIDFQLSKIIYSNGNSEMIISTWPKLSEDLEKSDNFGGYIKSFAKSSIFSDLDTLARIKRVDNYIKSHYTYNGNEQYFASGSKRDIEKTKRGNAADLNLMAVGMLRAEGINAYPAILSTRSHGKVNSAYPFLAAFDYVIVVYEVGDNMGVMDVTEPMLSFGNIPPRCLNDVCLLIKKEGVEWLNISSQEISDMRYIKVITPNPKSDSLVVDCSLTTTFFDAYNMRKKYSTDYESLATDLIGKDYILFDSITAVNFKDVEKPFQVTFSKKMSLETIDDIILIDPFEGEVMTENPLKLPTRTYPIDLGYRYSKTFSVDVNVPEGYKVSSQPENLVINNKDIRIVYTVTHKENSVVNITALYQFKKDVYDSSSYNTIKENIDLIVGKFNEKLILEPKGI